MRYGIILYLLLFIVFSTLAGCENMPFSTPKKSPSKKSQEAVSTFIKGTPVAKVNNAVITLEDLNREITIYNASLDFLGLSAEEKEKEKIDTREKKLNYLKNFVIRRLVLYQNALDRGIDRKEEVQKTLENNKIAILVSELQNEITKNIDVSATEIEDAYKRIKDQLREPEARKIREIVAKTEEEARQVLIELLQGADFASVARSRSVAASAKDGGDLGYIKRGQRGERFTVFDEVAFSLALEEGKISNVFNGPDGFYLIKIEGIKEGKQLELFEVRDRLKEQLLIAKQQQKIDELYSQLSHDAKIETNEGEIK